MLTLLSTTVGASGSAFGIPDPICWLLRVAQMVGVGDPHKYPGEG